MKRSLIYLLSASALVTSSLSFAKPIVIKFSHVVAENTPKGQMAEKFKELAEARLPGKVEVEVFPNSQLYTDDKVIPAMLLGDVQMAAPSLSKFERYTKKLQIFDLPFLFKDMQAVERFQNSPKGQELLQSMQSKGLLGLGYIHNGLKQISANSPLRVPKDAKGKQFRIQASDVLQEQFRALGAVGVKKPFSEVFTLLQTKALDGQENTWSNIYSKKFFEVQPYITETNHGVIDYLVVTSSSFWNDLDDDTRKVLRQSIDEAIAYGNTRSAEIAKNDRQKVIDSKRSQVLQITDEQRQQWVDVMKPVWKKFENDIGKDVIQAAVNANN